MATKLRSTRARFAVAIALVLIPFTSTFAYVCTEGWALEEFAGKIGLIDKSSFVELVCAIRDSGRLPARYVTKDQAKTRGWTGGGLCSIWPGHIIGGDKFMNFERKLPIKSGRTYFEADLDPTCRQRGPKRLVYSNDGRVYITIDHYKTFKDVLE